MLLELLVPQTAPATLDSGHSRVPRINKFGNRLLFMTVTAFNTDRIIVVIHVDILAGLLLSETD